MLLPCHCSSVMLTQPRLSPAPRDASTRNGLILGCYTVPGEVFKEFLTAIVTDPGLDLPREKAKPSSSI